jgi:polysaccharide export outer membrane protein
MNTRLLPLFFVWLMLLAPAAEAQNTEMALKAGDRIALSIGGVPAEDAAQISKVYSIGDSGTINLVNVGEVKAVGYKPSELQCVIEQEYIKKEMYKSPTVTVTIDGGEAPARFIYVVSGCQKCGPVAYHSRMTILKAVSVAGGFSPFAKPSKTKLIRNGVATPVNLRDISEDPSRDVKLEPEDQIIVPEN